MRERLRNLFGDEAFFTTTFAFTLAILAFLKGVRLPNLWSATQAQIDYSQGFTKRGMLGEIFALLHLHSYLAFTCISFFFLFVLCLLLWEFAWDTPTAHDHAYSLLAAIFFSSFAFTYMVSLVGYMDVLLAVLALLLLRFRKPAAQLLLGVPLVTVGILIHEMFVIVFVPVILLKLLLPLGQVANIETTTSPQPKWMSPAVLCFASVLVTLCVVNFGTLNPARTLSLYAHIVHNVDFPLRTDAIDVLIRSTTDNLKIMSAFWTDPTWWADQMWAALVFLPTTISFVWVSVRTISRSVNTRWVPATKALAVLSSMSPLLMNVLGWDVYRWWALAGLTSFLTMVTLLNGTAKIELPLNPLWRNAGLLLICVNIASGVGLLDYYRINTLPYRYLLEQAPQIYRTRQLPMPTR